MFQDDTISAVSTAIGEGGIGIIRLSGPQAIEVADQIFNGIGGRRVRDIGSFQAGYGHITDPRTGTNVDEVLALVMRAPRSYTREDVVEIHCHGGPVPLRRILELTLTHGARLAEPGEFTKRAFLNGRLDLTQAEAVIDVIRSKTDASLKMAVGHLSGQLRHEILRMIAHLEAAIDFPEEDIEQIASNEVSEFIRPVMDRLDALLASAQTGRILREGLQTVIIGKPNVGKSSLLNALLREKRAIVTDIPGTTRDIIEEYVNIRGIPLKIVDTAGLRETTDIVEQIGVEKAREFVASADLLLLLLDASAPLTPEDRDVLALLPGRQAIVLVNKSDLPNLLEVDEVQRLIEDRQLIRISVLEGSGLAELEQAIVDRVYGGQIIQSEGSFVNNVRHSNLLQVAKHRLSDALASIDNGMPPDCVVIDLRAAWDTLGEVTGDTVGEDIISQIFSQFCIGK